MIRPGVLRPRDGVAAADSVYVAIKDAVLSGALAPGERLAEEGLARQLNVSRTPVREALLRLEMERLTERGARGGLVVASVTPDEILAVYRVRQTMDRLAATLAAESAAPSEIARLRTLNERFRSAVEIGDTSRMSSINIEFHRTMARMGGNAFLAFFVEQIHDRVRRFPGTTFMEPGRAEAAITEHAEIIDAIEARDPGRASAAADRHMGNALRARITMIENDELAR